MLLHPRPSLVQGGRLPRVRRSDFVGIVRALASINRSFIHPVSRPYRRSEAPSARSVPWGRSSLTLHTTTPALHTTSPALHTTTPALHTTPPALHTSDRARPLRLPPREVEVIPAQWVVRARVGLGRVSLVRAPCEVWVVWVCAQ